MDNFAYPEDNGGSPLLAVLLAELARGKGVVGTRFSFRARSPVFVGDRFSLLDEPNHDGASLQAFRGNILAMEATISL